MNLRKQLRKESALKLKTAWDKLTTKQKIESLDNRLGFTVGAVKQRAKLAAKLMAESDTVNTPSAVKTEQKNEKKPYQKPKKS